MGGVEELRRPLAWRVRVATLARIVRLALLAWRVRVATLARIVRLAVIAACVAGAAWPSPSAAARGHRHESLADSTRDGARLDSRDAARDDAPAPMIAGLLPCTDELAARWPWSGTWVYPVGDSLQFGKGHVDEPGYRINRGVLRRASDGDEHDGADLANGLSGGWVRAAASGVVVTVEPRSGGGYGSYIVLAHHLGSSDGLVYTVYSHLLAGSTRVAEGATVSAGNYLARVGQTGRASTPHLHFEVRVPQDSTLRWEHCTVVDPVGFVAARLSEARPDSDWAAPYLVWAEFAALIPRGLKSDATVDTALFKHLAHSLGTPVMASNEARGTSATPRVAPSELAEWNVVASALTSLKARRNRLAPCSIESARTARLSAEHLGMKRPSKELHRLAARDTPPTVGELCLALADFARAPEKHAKPKKHARAQKKKARRG